MNLLDSLLDAIARLDGDALVMHVGEKPYVVTTSEVAQEFRGPLSWGQVELSSRELTPDAVTGMLGQILPLDQRSALDGYGATEFEVTASDNPLERFTIVAARGGDDIWVEVRRRRQPTAAPVTVQSDAPSPAVETPAEHPVQISEEPRAVEPEAVAPAAAERPTHGKAAESEAVAAVNLEPSIEAPQPVLREDVIDFEASAFNLEADVDMSFIDATQEWGDDVMTEGDLGELLRASAAAIVTGDAGDREASDWSQDETVTDLSDELFAAAGQAGEQSGSSMSETETSVTGEYEIGFGDEAADSHQIELAMNEPQPIAEAGVAESQPIAEGGVPRSEQQLGIPPAAISAALTAESMTEPLAAPLDQPMVLAEPIVSAAADEQIDASGADASVGEAIVEPSQPQPVAKTTPEAVEAQSVESEDEAEEQRRPARPSAIVVPMSRQPKADTTVGRRAASGPSLDRLLRLAAARGAATLYVVAQSPPMIRVDGEFSTLDGEPPLTVSFIEGLLTEVLPAGRESASAESHIDVPEIGRVRCVAFRDHRGPGLILRMVPARAISAEQLGLSAEVQALCTEADGLILVTGARGSGKSTLLTSFVDLINRTRSDHIITTEAQIEFVHEHQRSFISQREVRADGDAFVAAVRAACREEPDVLVIDDMRTPEIVSLALEAAESGRLIFACVPGLSITSALERIIEMFPAERREKVQASLAGTLRGVVSQVLLRKLRGGRVAAREVLLNTPPVTSLILEGKIFELPTAIESGKRAGMTSFAESLAALVREGTVHPSHAYRKAPNREQFLAILRRDGVDVSMAERLA